MNKISRRTFLKTATVGAAISTSTASLIGCKNKAGSTRQLVEPPVGKMTYRTNSNTGDRVSLLGYGMMRLPIEGGGSGRENPDTPIDQEMVNRQVDYAIAHGVNYFDTSPAYCQGRSEHATGIALSRHPRNKYYIATKLSNFAPETWSRAKSQEMFENSLHELQVEHVDYLLLHGIGMSAEEKDALEAFNARYIDNGILDWLVEQKQKGRIRNLGFSYHGDISIFDMLLSWHDEGRYHWDFVQIELNYLDWNYADEINERNTDAEYLYAELKKRAIPAVIMEPLLGGRLANVPDPIVAKMKQRDPEASVASWAFRYAGTPAGVLTVLSGMTYMEHLKDNLLSYCPLTPLTEKEMRYLDTDIAQKIVGLENIPCNDCKYCMPCPYGIDIPAIFVHYNKCKNEGSLPMGVGDSEYRENRRKYLISLDRAVPRDRQPDHCIQCGQCVPHCPQNIRIPRELAKIDKMIEELKQNPYSVKPQE